MIGLKTSTHSQIKSHTQDESAESLIHQPKDKDKISAIGTILHSLLGKSARRLASNSKDSHLAAPGNQDTVQRERLKRKEAVEPTSGHREMEGRGRQGQA